MVDEVEEEAPVETNAFVKYYNEAGPIVQRIVRSIIYVFTVAALLTVGFACISFMLWDNVFGNKIVLDAYRIGIVLSIFYVEVIWLMGKLKEFFDDF